MRVNVGHGLSLEQDHPEREQRDVQPDEGHGPREGGDPIRESELHIFGPLAVQAHDDRMTPADGRMTGVITHVAHRPPSKVWSRARRGGDSRRARGSGRPEGRQTVG